MIFSTNSNKDLAKELASKTNLKLGRLEIKKLSDGETYIRVKENVKGKKVYVLGSTFQPEKNFIELIILLNCLKVNKAKEIILILPYFGYGRQDFIDRPGAPLTAKLMADIIKLTGVHKIIAIDLHSNDVVRYFGAKLNYLTAIEILMRNCKKDLDLKRTIVISPDKGAKARAQKTAKILGGLPIIVLKKYRPRQNIAEVLTIKQDLTGKTILIVDDMADTAGTLVAAVKELKKQGARIIICAVTHGVLSGPAVNRIKNSAIDKLYITDTIPLEAAKKNVKIKVVSVADLIKNNL